MFNSPSPSGRASLATAGCEASGQKPKRSPFHPRAAGEGKAGLVVVVLDLLDDGIDSQHTPPQLALRTPFSALELLALDKPKT